ncbi:MAG: MATE family efflux transporter [Faecalibacterium sp.]
MTKDMTTGAITPLLVKFTIPLVLGNLFQLTYNAVDSIIVGRFVGEDALAAVGTSNPLMTLAILFINGMCLGAGILVSTAFGAGNTALVERQVSTTAIAGAGFSLAFSAVCVLLADPLLRLMQVPESLLPLAAGYLRIVFAGLIFTFFYNFLAATMRALGDSQSALYFLMVSAVLNVCGDLFFVKALGWGAPGCALSTVLSEALCCLLCVLYIQRRLPILQLGRRWFVFDRSLLRKTVSYGWASAMQQATVQLGKIAVQAIVNTMGVSAMAAFTAASRIDDFAYTPQQNIGHAMTTLMAQNRGAGKKDRVRRGFFCGMGLEFVYALALTVLCFAAAEPIIRLFAADAEVVALGVRFLRMISLLYFMPAATNGIQGFFRGMGDLKITLRSSMLNMLGRVAAAAVFILLLRLDIEALPWSYAVGWLLMLVYELPPLFRMLRNEDGGFVPF